MDLKGLVEHPMDFDVSTMFPLFFSGVLLELGTLESSFEHGSVVSASSQILIAGRMSNLG